MGYRLLRRLRGQVAGSCGPLCPRYRSVDPALEDRLHKRASCMGDVLGCVRTVSCSRHRLIERRFPPASTYDAHTSHGNPLIGIAVVCCRAADPADGATAALDPPTRSSHVQYRRSLDHCLANRSPHVVVATTDGARRDGPARIRCLDYIGRWHRRKLSYRVLQRRHR